MFQSDGAYASQLETKLKAFSLSTEAAQAVMKALHPVFGPAVQWPDSVSVPTIVPQYTNTLVLSAPGGLASPTWDACVISVPSDNIAAFWATGEAGTNFGTTVSDAFGVIANATAVNSVAGTPPYAGVQAFTSSPTVVPFNGAWSSELPTMWRTVAKSLTAYSAGSALYDQGTCYAGQYSRDIIDSPSGINENTSGSGIVSALSSVEIPLDEETMALMTPNLYVAPAREGVYSVHRLSGPSQPFVQKKECNVWSNPDHSNTWVGIVIPGGSGTYALPTNRYIRFRQVGSTPGTSVPTDRLTPAFPYSPMAYPSTGFDSGCSWGVTIFRGLHPLQTVCIKTVTVVELVPSVFSPNRQFIKPPCRFEPTAIQAYYAIASEMPDCVASKHNLFGTLLPILSSVASRVLPFLAPALKAGAQTLLGTVASRLSAPSAAPQAAPAQVRGMPQMLRVPSSLRPRSRSVGSRRSSLSRGSVRRGSKARVRIRAKRARRGA